MAVSDVIFFGAGASASKGSPVQKVLFSADIHSRMQIFLYNLLKRVELNHNSAPEIYVINEYDDKQNQQKIIEKQHFMRFFREKDRLHYLDLSFKDFFDRGYL